MSYTTHGRKPSPTGLFAVDVQIEAAINDVCGDDAYCRRDLGPALTELETRTLDTLARKVAAIIADHSLKPDVCRPMWVEMRA